MKDHLRYYLGQTLKALGTSELVREYYLRSAEKYVSQAGPEVKGAWIRRSLTSSDFTPLVSDVDLTVLIDIDSIPGLMNSQKLSPRHLIRDIQIVAAPFLKDWELTGGFRNRQLPSWIIIKGGSLNEPPLLPRPEIAFELAHEIILLYEQLASRLIHGLPATIKKLGLELERLFDFWQSLDPGILNVPREIFFSPDLIDDFPAFLRRHEAFWGEILSHLHSPMNEYELSLLEKENFRYGSTLFLEIRKKEVFLLKDLSALEEAKINFKNHFIATPNIIRLLKGAGVQEQSLLNQVAGGKGYYRSFCRQRLAHDLIGTLLQDPDNHRRLYYCFRNNQEFFEALSLDPAPGWNELSRGPEGAIPWENSELLKVSLRNLEVLGQLG